MSNIKTCLPFGLLKPRVKLAYGRNGSMYPARIEVCRNVPHLVYIGLNSNYTKTTLDTGPGDSRRQEKEQH